jgi:hypothetical protein
MGRERERELGALSLKFADIITRAHACADGWACRVLFDSEAPVADFGKLQLCESVRAVLMHQDYEIDLGPAPSMGTLSSWLVETADWDLGLDLFRHFGNAAPECPDFTGIASLSVFFMRLPSCFRAGVAQTKEGVFDRASLSESSFSPAP